MGFELTAADIVDGERSVDRVYRLGADSDASAAQWLAALEKATAEATSKAPRRAQ